MPNWCDTTYKAVGTKESVKKFYNLAMSSWNKSENDNSGWLGHFVTELGEKWENVHCRGWMQDEPGLSDDGEMCTIYCNTAWGELSEWREFIEKHIDGLSLLYVAIEPGCGVYCSNDDAYADKYYVDCWVDGSYDMTAVETIDYVNRNFDQSFTTIDECMDFAETHLDADGDRDLWINKFEIE